MFMMIIEIFFIFSTYVQNVKKIYLMFPRYVQNNHKIFFMFPRYEQDDDKIFFMFTRYVQYDFKNILDVLQICTDLSIIYCTYFYIVHTQVGLLGNLCFFYHLTLPFALSICPYHLPLAFGLIQIFSMHF